MSHFDYKASQQFAKMDLPPPQRGRRQQGALEQAEASSMEQEGSRLKASAPDSVDTPNPGRKG
jgi:hypothetical protein